MRNEWFVFTPFVQANRGMQTSVSPDITGRETGCRSALVIVSHPSCSPWTLDSRTADLDKSAVDNVDAVRCSHTARQRHVTGRRFIPIPRRTHAKAQLQQAAIVCHLLMHRGGD